jgi:hypothetical protein
LVFFDCPSIVAAASKIKGKVLKKFTSCHFFNGEYYPANIRFHERPRTRGIKTLVSELTYWEGGKKTRPNQLKSRKSLKVSTKAFHFQKFNKKNNGTEKKAGNNYLPLQESAILFPIVLNLAKNGAINTVKAKLNVHGYRVS